jgi:hypothetical protein
MGANLIGGLRQPRLRSEFVDVAQKRAGLPGGHSRYSPVSGSPYLGFPGTGKSLYLFMILRLKSAARLASDPLRGIAVRLDAEGIRPRRGKRWIHTTVKSTLARWAA